MGEKCREFNSPRGTRGKMGMKGKNYTEVEIKIALGKKVYMLPTHILEEIGEKNNVGGRVRVRVRGI